MKRRAFIGALAGFAAVASRRSSAHAAPRGDEALRVAVLGPSAPSLPAAMRARIVAVADPDDRAARALADACGRPDGSVTACRDFRDLLRRDDVDMVAITAPAHWHGVMAVLAMRAGRDVWCAAPMARTVAECSSMAETAHATGRSLRVDTPRASGWTQGVPAFVGEVRAAVEEGRLGWPLRVTLSPDTGFPWPCVAGRTLLRPMPEPDWLDYDLWLGPAQWQPYHEDRVANPWGYWDYGGGVFGMCQGWFDAAQMVLGKDGESPVEVEADAPQQHPDAVGPWRRVILRYADDCVLELAAERGPDQAAVPFVSGPQGRYTPGKGWDPPALGRDLSEPDLPVHAGDEPVTGLSARWRTMSTVEALRRSGMLTGLARTAVRLGRSLRFDGAQLRFVNDPAACRLLAQPQRAPWRW